MGVIDTVSGVVPAARYATPPPVYTAPYATHLYPGYAAPAVVAAPRRPPPPPVQRSASPSVLPPPPPRGDQRPAYSRHDPLPQFDLS